MNKEEETTNNDENEVEIPSEKKQFPANIISSMDQKYPKLMERLRNTRVQMTLIFIVLLIIYLNLIIWDFWFSSDSVPYGLTMKGWFEEGEIDTLELLRPAHPLTMPLAIFFTYLVRPITGSNYLLSYAILNAIMGAATVALFYWVCQKFAASKKFALFCSLGLAFSFAYWENCEMAEDKSLGFMFLVLIIPFIFAYVGEIDVHPRFDNLKEWKKGLVLGIIMGFLLASHVSFILFFLFTVIIILRYLGIKHFKSPGFIFFIIGAAAVCLIVFGIVAIALEVDSIGGFIGMFTTYHTGEGGKQFFALAEPQSFSVTSQLRGTAGGVFTTFFMFITQEGAYYPVILAIGAVMFVFLAFILIQAGKNKVVNSFFILMGIWFANYFVFAPDDRNAWVYLLVPVWLSIFIGLNKIESEGACLCVIKRQLPNKVKTIITPIIAVVVAILLVNNGAVFADVHFNHDEREEFVNFVNHNIPEGDAIIIVDDSVLYFFDYYSDRPDMETIHYAEVVLNPDVSGHINSSFGNGTQIYVAEYWLLDSYVQMGSARGQQSYDERLERHQGIVDRFNDMYEYEPAYQYDWSDIFRITNIR
jgi:MFS family permease